MTPIERKARELLAAELDAGELLGARDRVADGELLTPVEKAAIRAIVAALRAAGNRSEPEYDRELIAEMLEWVADSDLGPSDFRVDAALKQARLLRAADNRDAAGVAEEYDEGPTWVHDGKRISAVFNGDGKVGLVITANPGAMNGRIEFIGAPAAIPNTPTAAPAGEAVALPFNFRLEPEWEEDGMLLLRYFVGEEGNAKCVWEELVCPPAVTHPPAAEVDEAMVERAEQAFARAQGRAAAGRMYGNTSYEVYHEAMRAALTAARLPAAEVREVDGWTIERHTGRDGVPGVWAKNSDGSRVWIAALTKED